MRSLLLLFTISGLSFAQHLLSVGIKGGVPLSDILSDKTFTSVDVVTRVFSDSKNYVIGPTVELKLPAGFAIEADALYRPLTVTTQTRVIPQSPTLRSIDVHSMEFPILAKYHFTHTPIVKPYAEAGPIFRYVAEDAGYLSRGGFAMGAGVDFKLLLVRITPELRYSRWGSDSAPTAAKFVGLPYVPSKQNQAEFLIGLSF